MEDTRGPSEAPAAWLPGVHPAPNIQGDSVAYEYLNVAMDADPAVWAEISRHFDWSGRIVLDIGAGDGFHLPRFAENAQHVFAIEPSNESRLRAMERVARQGIENVSIMVGSAEKTNLMPRTVDFIHARFAYFWGPGCEPGISEMKRILRKDGAIVIVDNDFERGDFACWLREASQYSPEYKAPDSESQKRFWREHGFQEISILARLRFTDASKMHRALKNEFPPEYYERKLRHISTLTPTYGYLLYVYSNVDRQF